MRSLFQQSNSSLTGQRLIYAGIGSESTPTPVLWLMSEIASKLAKEGYTLRTGTQGGAPQAFLEGCEEAEGESEIWHLPQKVSGQTHHGLEPHDRHAFTAATLNPTWSISSAKMKAEHARYVALILGNDMNTPVKFVVCFTPDGCTSAKERTLKTGRAGTAIALASRYDIPVLNLARPEVNARMLDLIDSEVEA